MVGFSRTKRSVMGQEEGSMTIRSLLKRFGLMKISDAREIAIAIEKKRLENLKMWFKEDAPDLYRVWKEDAEQEAVQWVNEVFSTVEKSEWFIRK